MEKKIYQSNMPSPMSSVYLNFGRLFICSSVRPLGGGGGAGAILGLPLTIFTLFAPDMLANGSPSLNVD